ncbi:GyrI-like domain-containing protein [Marinimicrobium alkaliphilum]|uniref:GyrI-like domain-containing protein n=1 Tax=Marinimicrobium alkaliphilum TaxID=2202654 RepID=UPI000DB99F30|nr:GyrI-like domain-containing protein [Marinimicrobium alkaliphilum]
MLRLEHSGDLHLAGIRRRIKARPMKEIAPLWQQFSVYQGWVPGQIGRTRYGVSLYVREDAGLFDYLACTQVATLDGLTSEWNKLTLPAQQYAVFEHAGHVSRMRQTVQHIFAAGLSAARLKPARPQLGNVMLIERYGASFNPQTGWGEIQVWGPVEKVSQATTTSARVRAEETVCNP